MSEKYRHIERILRDVLKQTKCNVTDHHIREALYWLEQCE